ncbi:MAG: hypothetical protein EOO73_19395 [Myxococcales bacterium]|nr:MAG: hypothetical protein EOO73_19395 [Myxococcales bacterium]
MLEPHKPSSGYRVVKQYQSDGERVYELDSAGTRLEIRVSSRSAGSGQRSWHVSAQLGGVSDAIVLSESGATKSEALTKVSALWSEQDTAHALPSLDWPAVAQALLAVRGI